MRIAEFVSSRQNNFDALRLIAAVMVLVSHCFALTAHSEPFASISGQSLGEVGVSIFFAISGFLIARSWSSDSSVVRFVIKRGLRLLPALVVAVLVTALIVGPAVTTLSTTSYLTNPGVYRYIAENSVLYTINGRLPGVFVHNVYPAAVNGSLWTLPIEAIAYICAAVLGVIGALRGRGILPVLSFAGLLAATTPLLPTTSLGASSATSGNVNLVLYLGGMFNAGLLLYVLRDRVPLRWDIAGVLTILWIATFGTVWVRTSAMLAIPYVMLVLAYRAPRSLSVISRPGDVSYGVYVYSFPAQQVASYAWGASITPLIMLGLVAMPVYLLAFLSWRVIEAPALRLKSRVTKSADPRRTLVRATAVD